MAFDRKYLKLSWIFEDISSTETAVTSCTVAGTTTGYDPVPDLAAITPTQFETLMTAYATLAAYAQVKWGDYSRLTSMKAAAIDTAGHYLTDPVVHDRTGAAIAGTAADVWPQMSVVLSLWSGATLGKGNYGRMYLPHMGLVLADNTSSGGATDQGNFSVHAVTFLQAVNTVAGALSTGTGLRIMHDGGFSKAVAKVRVGCVSDTQRRRRRQIPENLSVGTQSL